MQTKLGIQISARFTKPFESVDDTDAATRVLDQAGEKWEEDGPTGYLMWRNRNGAPRTQSWIPEGTDAFVVANDTLVMVPPKAWSREEATRRMEQLRDGVAADVAKYGYRNCEVEGKLVEEKDWPWSS